MGKISEDQTCPCGSGLIYKECHLKYQLTKPAKVVRIISCALIPEPAPDTRAVFARLGPPDETVVWSSFSDEASFHCGNCGSPLLEFMHVKSTPSIVVVCNRCHAFNDVAATRDGYLAKNGMDTTIKLSRNQLCYCGSGLKYKHCHGKL